jgi:hypothetical protein
VLVVTPVILTTQEAEIRRIVVWSHPRQIVHKTLLQKTKKKPSQKRAGGVTQALSSSPSTKNKYIPYNSVYTSFRVGKTNLS